MTPAIETFLARGKFRAEVEGRMSAALYDRIGGREKLLPLLHSFYADVRQHQVIGPIFNERIKDWNAHILKIAEFWSRITGGPSVYPGGMAARHLTLGLEPKHFTAWLGLWEFNCRLHLAPEEAEELIAVAHDIGRRLSQIVSSQGRFSGLRIGSP